MTIFHILKYPIDNFQTSHGINGMKAVLNDHPRIFNDWYDTIWKPWHESKPGPAHPRPRDVSTPVSVLRKMLLDYEGPL